MSNILVFSRNSFAQRQLNAHSRRVANAGGIIQDGDAIARRYELYGKLGIFPRRDYSALGGALLNGQSVTNLLLWSQDFTQTVWTKTDVTVTANAIANPVNGNVDADLITEGSAGTAFNVQTYTVSSGATCTNSIYIRKNALVDWIGFAIAESGGVNGLITYFNLSTGAKGSTILLGSGVSFNSTIESLGSSWYRITVSGSNPTFTSYRLSFRSASADNSTTRVANCSYYVYGAQAQTGTIATDPITSLGTQGVATQSFAQTLFDLNNTAPVDAIQSTAANQPYWGLDPDTGFNVPLFDGSNDFMSVNDLGIFNAQSAGTVVTVAKDLNRTGGDATHVTVQVSTALGNTRAGIVTRDLSLSEFRANARKLDADAIVTSLLTSANGYNYLAGSYLWSSNLLRLTANGTEATAGNFIGASTTTSATDSSAFTIGATNATTNRLNGYVAELPIFRTALSAAQIQAIRNLFKSNYRTLP